MMVNVNFKVKVLVFRYHLSFHNNLELSLNYYHGTSTFNALIWQLAKTCFLHVLLTY